jgi:hypothetical protein
MAGSVAWNEGNFVDNVRNCHLPQEYSATCSYRLTFVCAATRRMWE